MIPSQPGRRRRWASLLAGALACSGTIALTSPAAAREQDTTRRGGSVAWALEAETDPSNGYCLPRGQLAASGIQVASAIFDTLVTQNSKGEYVPFLARSVTPDADYTEWTIQVRDGVTFHDGSKLDAEAVKLNLDSYRGANPSVSSLVGAISFTDVDSVTVTGPMTVVVTTKVPWVQFPAFLYGTGRLGIMAPAQLADQSTCPRNPIGTGPFKFVEWRPNEHLVVERNPDYWQPGLPYLDRITFRPVPELGQRINGVRGGDFDLIQTSTPSSILELDELAAAGEVRYEASDRGAETGYLLLNLTRPPFDDPLARRAVAYAVDMEQVNNVRNESLNTLATGPFPPGNPAHVPRSPYPHDVEKAKALAKEYEEKHGEPLRWEYLAVAVPETIAIAELVQEQNRQAGIEVDVRTVDQAELINEMLDSSYQGVATRNHPGGAPDTQYVWWHSGLLSNLNRIDDPVIDRLLEAGRSEADVSRQAAIYKRVNRRLGVQAYDIWMWHTTWAVGTGNDIRGIEGAPLPDGHGKPFLLFAGVTPVAGIYRTE